MLSLPSADQGPSLIHSISALCPLSTQVTGPTSAEQRGRDPLSGRHPPSGEAVRPGNIMMTTDGHSRDPHRVGGARAGPGAGLRPQSTLSGAGVGVLGDRCLRRLHGAPCLLAPPPLPHPHLSPRQSKASRASRLRAGDKTQNGSPPSRHWLVGCIPPATGSVSSGGDIIKVSILVMSCDFAPEAGELAQGTEAPGSIPTLLSQSLWI